MEFWGCWPEQWDCSLTRHCTSVCSFEKVGMEPSKDNSSLQLGCWRIWYGRYYQISMCDEWLPVTFLLFPFLSLMRAGEEEHQSSIFSFIIHILFFTIIYIYLWKDSFFKAFYWFSLVFREKNTFFYDLEIIEHLIIFYHEVHSLIFYLL